MRGSTSAAVELRHRSLGLDSAITFGGKGLVAAANFTSTVLVARTFGPEGQGLIAVVLTMTLLLVQLGSLGFATANPAWTARSAAPTESIVANSLWLGAVIGTTLAIVGVGAKAARIPVLAELEWEEAGAIFAAAPFALTVVLLQGVLLGQRRTLGYNGGELALSVGTLFVLGFALFVVDVGPLGAIIVLLAQYPTGVLLYLYLLRADTQMFRPTPALARAMLGFALRVYMATVIGYLLVRIDLLLVSVILGEREAGLYSVAAVLAQVLYLLPVVIGLNLMPRVAKEGGHERTATVFRLLAIPFASLCLLAGLLAVPAIHLIFGAEFDASVNLLRGLLPGIYFLGMVGILNYHLAAHDYPIEAVAYWALALVINLALNLALLDRYGTIVAPIVSSVAYAIVFVLQLRMFGKMIGDLGKLKPRLDETVAAIRIVSRRISQVRRAA